MKLIVFIFDDEFVIGLFFCFVLEMNYEVINFIEVLEVY